MNLCDDGLPAVNLTANKLSSVRLDMKVETNGHDDRAAL